MDNVVLLEFIRECNSELIADKPVLYEAYFLKIYVAFERFLGDLFEEYCLGNSSSKGYVPRRKLDFDCLEQLRNVLNSGKKLNYIDYIDKIKNLSKNIFDDNPFDILLEDAENVTYFNQMTLLRNCIAHESEFSKKKYKEGCLANGDFIPPGEFLIAKKSGHTQSNYTLFVNKIIEISEGLITPAEEA